MPLHFDGMIYTNSNPIIYCDVTMGIPSNVINYVVS